MHVALCVGLARLAAFSLLTANAVALFLKGVKCVRVCLASPAHRLTRELTVSQSVALFRESHSRPAEQAQ